MKRALYMVLIVIVCITGFFVGKKVYTVENPVIDNSEEISEEGTSIGTFFSDALSSLQAAKKEDLKAKYEQARAVSNETKGWIWIENTRIDYPIMLGQNNYYLNRSYDRKSSSSGSIFLDEAQPGFGNVNVIHGHNMLNGKMFTDLHKFYRAETKDQMKYVYIYDGESDIERKFEVFSVMRVSASYSLKMNIGNLADTKVYAQELKNQSAYKYNFTLEEKPILILNTCFSDGTNDHLIVALQEIENN